MRTQSAHSLVLCATAADRRPQLAQDPRLPGALHLIDQLLYCGSPPAAIAAGLRDVLRDRLDTELPPGPAGGAALLAWLLRYRTAPFTPVVAALTGRPVTVEVLDGTEREHRLPGAEAMLLDVMDEAALQAWSRKGLMMAGDLVAAEVELTLIPIRVGGIDGENMRRIRKGEPCGQVLPGIVRTQRAGRDRWPADPSVHSAARLGIAGRGIGIAREHVSQDLVTAIP